MEDYTVKWKGESWLKINYDSGAATAAIPDEMVAGDLESKGEFIVASGEQIANYGRFRVPAVDARGKQRSFSGFATKVHKPFRSAAKFSKSHDCLLWAEGGSLIPKASPLAKGLRKEYYRLKKIHADCDELPIFREGNLFNMHLKQDGEVKQLSPLHEGPASGNSRQAKL